MSTITTSTTWMAAAVCRDVDPEVFFPTADDQGAAPAEQVAAAKQVCAGCPVRVACLAFALDALPYGVAGGHTAAERRTIRRQQASGGAR